MLISTNPVIPVITLYTCLWLLLLHIFGRFSCLAIVQSRWVWLSEGPLYNMLFMCPLRCYMCLTFWLMTIGLYACPCTTVSVFLTKI